MTSYHISKDGVPRPCAALVGSCPLVEEDGTPAVHGDFASVQEAWALAEVVNERRYAAGLFHGLASEHREFKRRDGEDGFIGYLSTPSGMAAYVVSKQRESETAVILDGASWEFLQNGKEATIPPESLADEQARVEEMFPGKTVKFYGTTEAYYRAEEIV